MSLGNRYNQHSFAEVPDVFMARSRFDRSHTVKDTMQFDYLTPIFIDDVVPGDTCNVTLNTFGRLASPTKVPVMDNMYIDFFFFYVPYRLVWSNFKKMMGEQVNPGDSTDFTFPTMTFAAGGPEVGLLADHFGLPTDVGPGYKINNCLPFRAYNLIWNEWFRSPFLQTIAPVPMGDGPDNPSDYGLLKRGRRHDYFSSALPWPQRGPAVELPIAGLAPVYGTGKALGLTDGTINMGLQMNSGSTLVIPGANSYNQNVGVVTAFTSTGGSSKAIGVVQTGVSGLQADLSSAVAPTVNEFREAILMQSLFELDARAGARYNEIVLAHYNVQIPDFTLQRPEFLGGGSTRINTHPVAVTAPGTASSPVGALGAFGTTSSNGENIGFTKSILEHGMVIGLACARADVTYQQGIERMWLKETRYDLFWPKLQELGEQAIFNAEIYLQGTAADYNVFGYQERYAEYKYKPSQIRGEFRSTYATPLDYYHMAEKFATLPQLNNQFMVQNTPIERALSVTSGPDLLMDMWFKYYHSRPMKAYAVPATLGRF